MATLKQAIENREGDKQSANAIYKQIIEECNDAVNEGRCEDIENILHDAGFEPDYIFDVIEALS